MRVDGKRGGSSTDVNARFERSGTFGMLRATGGPSNELIITVRVPKVANLFVRINARDVEVEGVRGNKDIELHAGDLTIVGGDVAD